MVSTTSSKVEPHTAPLLIVQRRVALVPAGTPVTVVTALAGVVIVAVPEIKVHSPVPGAAAFAVIVKLDVLHWSLSTPASAVGAGAVFVKTISSKLLPQLFEIVHLTVALVPAAMPVTVVFGKDVLVMVAVPACKLHTPVPTTAVLAAIEKMPLLHCSMSVPASAAVGVSVLVITTSSKVDPHTAPLLIVQRNVALDPTGTPVTVVDALAGVVIVAVPEIKVHNPVPGAAAFAVIVKLDVLH